MVPNKRWEKGSDKMPCDNQENCQSWHQIRICKRSLLWILIMPMYANPSILVVYWVAQLSNAHITIAWGVSSPQPKKISVGIGVYKLQPLCSKLHEKVWVREVREGKFFSTPYNTIWGRGAGCRPIWSDSFQHTPLKQKSPGFRAT